MCRLFRRRIQRAIPPKCTIFLDEICIKNGVPLSARDAGHQIRNYLFLRPPLDEMKFPESNSIGQQNVCAVCSASVVRPQFGSVTKRVNSCKQSQVDERCRRPGSVEHTRNCGYFRSPFRAKWLTESIVCFFGRNGVADEWRGGGGR